MEGFANNIFILNKTRDSISLFKFERCFFRLVFFEVVIFFQS